VNSEGSLSLAGHFDPQTKVFDFGDWPENPEKETAAPGLPQLRWAYQNWSSLLQLRQYAVDFSASGMEQRKKRNFGLLMHEVLEKSESLKAAKSLLQAYYFEGRLSQEELFEVESQLDQLFAKPLFSSWFETDGVLLSEQGILLPDGSQKRPDRIILKKDISIIVDFKTGVESTKHESQVQVYKDLVAGLTQKPVKGYLCYLESGKVVEVR
jgi:ATP-dependent exoDNAse (exonuclease V) beta subunit